VESCNWVISRGNTITTEEESARGKGKRRKLNVEVGEEDGMWMRYPEQLVQAVAEMIEKEKVSSYKENPQKIVAG
jgi:hypothetical protein